MVITKLFKVGRNVTKMEYPVICGHLPFCAGDVPLHPEKITLNAYPLNPITIIFNVTITSNVAVILPSTLTLWIMMRITWKAETQSESFPFADVKSRPLGSSSHQPPKLKQIFGFKVKSIHCLNYFLKLKIFNVRNPFANEKSGLAGWYHLAPLPPKLKQSWLETLEERAGCNWKWELPSRAAARAQKKEALKAHKKSTKRKQECPMLCILWVVLSRVGA